MSSRTNKTVVAIRNILDVTVATNDELDTIADFVDGFGAYTKDLTAATRKLLPSLEAERRVVLQKNDDVDTVVYPVLESKGVVSGKKMKVVVLGLFEHNARCSKAARRTDEELFEMLAEDFPVRCATSKQLRVNGIKNLRWYYNRGGYFTAEAPKVKSVAYDAKGNPIK